MSSTAEKTYGARINNCLTIATTISNLADFTTDQQELLPQNYLAFAQSVAADNLARTAAEQNYSTSVAARKQFYRGGADSVIPLLALINAAVSARYGKKSVEFTQISAAVKKMRGAKPVEYSKKDIDGNETGTTIKVSQSQLSYGSIIEAFSELVTKLAALDNYDSPRAELKLPALQNKILQANTLNRNVDAALTAYKLAQVKRVDNYKILSERGNKIKALMLSLYGPKSTIYKSVAKLSI